MACLLCGAMDARPYRLRVCCRACWSEICYLTGEWAVSQLGMLDVLYAEHWRSLA